MTRLIFRIESASDLVDAPILNFSMDSLEPDLFTFRIGEEVAFGLSEAAGMWRVLALGRLAGCEQAESSILVRFDSVVMLAPSARLVTQGDKRTDFVPGSYKLDVFSASDLKRLRAHIQYHQAEENAFFSAQEGGQLEICPGENAYGQTGARLDETGFFNRVSAAYENKCTFTGIAQSAPNGLAWEGEAVALDPERCWGGPASRGLYASSTFAFCFKQGLLAIGDRYDILQHRRLNAKISAFLAAANPERLLFLPERGTDWPDIGMVQRHRRYFDY